MTTGQTATMTGLVVAAYLIGAIPFGLIVGLMRGVDIRQVGSKNIGATNAGRVLGKKFFIFVLFLDAMKSLIPTVVAGQVLERSGVWSASPVLASFLWLAVACAAVIGHNFPIYLGFKGGKGVATSLGVVLAIFPYFTWPGVAAFALWTLIVWRTGYVSLGSIVGTIAFFVAHVVLSLTLPSWQFAEHWPLTLFAGVMATMLVVRHRSNIQRLRAGTEPKFYERRKAETA